MNGADRLERMTGLNKSILLRRGGGTSSAGARKKAFNRSEPAARAAGHNKVFLRVRDDHEPHRRSASLAHGTGPMGPARFFGPPE
jgi:hypothetical protein